MKETEEAALIRLESTNLQEPRMTATAGAVSETGGRRASVVAAVLALAALAGVAYLVLSQYGAREERLTRGNAASWRQA